jgi:hypothetical protein
MARPAWGLNLCRRPPDKQHPVPQDSDEMQGYMIFQNISRVTQQQGGYPPTARNPATEGRNKWLLHRPKIKNRGSTLLLDTDTVLLTMADTPLLNLPHNYRHYLPHNYRYYLRRPHQPQDHIRHARRAP